LDESLNIVNTGGQTGSHSFANSLQSSADAGTVYGYEVCDNYPRGLNLWNIRTTGTGSKQDTKVVYQFKAKHSSVPTGSPCEAYGSTWPEWPEAIWDDPSKAAVKFCKQSNDNSVYTEIARPFSGHADVRTILPYMDDFYHVRAIRITV